MEKIKEEVFKPIENTPQKKGNKPLNQTVIARNL